MEKFILIVSIILFIILSSISSKEYRKLEDKKDEDEVEIIKIDFENQNIGIFEKRGEEVKLSIEKDYEITDNHYLLVSSRTKDWHGAQILIDDICFPGNEYAVSCDIRKQDGGKIILSLQYNDYTGSQRFIRLKTVDVPGKEWFNLKEKFSIPDIVSDIYLYFESNEGDTKDISIDNFILTKVPFTDIQTDIPSLKNAFKNKFKIGTSVSVEMISSLSTQKLIQKHFNSITLENELKPENLLDLNATLQYAKKNEDYTNPIINIASAAIILNFCKEKKISVRGHTFIWYSQTPTWFFKEKWDINGKWVDKETLLKRMENFIKNVFESVIKAYPTIDFYAWDIVNEIFQPNGESHKEDKSIWVKIFGDNSFVKHAFKFAKKYAPVGCKLFYNECDEYDHDKFPAIINLVDEVNSEEKLIDGIGLQSHLDVQYPLVKNYETAIKAYAKTGYDLQITELQVTIISNTTEFLEAQANYYKEIMSILLNYSDSISAVVFWGTLDSDSWKSPNYPLLFNENFTAKPCFYSIAELGNTTAGDDDPDYDDDKKQNYTILINASFEDNELNNFQPRGNVSVSIKTDGGKVGNNYLLVTGRNEAWNGVQIPLNDICSEGKQYILSCFLKSRKQSQIILSMQYNDGLGEEKYQNLKTIRTLEDWSELKQFRFTYPNDVTNVLIYFESNSPDDDIFVDEFVLKEVPEITIQTDIPSLKDVYDSFFKIGAATTYSQIIVRPTQRLILKHFNSITLENELKPSSLLDYEATIELAQESGDYSTPAIKIDTASKILEFCQKNKISVRGHTLVSYNTPLWFFKEKWDEKGDWVDKETMLQRMEKYIQEVMKKIAENYPNIDFYAWDVVTEALLDNGNMRSGDSQEGGDQFSPYVKIFGDNSYIRYAFQYAKKYATNGCKLYYTDFNEYIKSKTNAIIKLVKEINRAEQLIDGIGLESHLDIQYPSISDYEEAIKTFCETGLDIQITGLDVSIRDNSIINFKTQAIYYREIMDILVKYSKNISLVSFWGTIDSSSWKNTQYPLLFDNEYKAKPSFNSIIEIIQNDD